MRKLFVGFFIAAMAVSSMGTTNAAFVNVLDLDADDATSSGFTITRVTAGNTVTYSCLLYTSPSPRDQRGTRMPSSA